MSEKIKVVSMCDGRCGIDNADLNISRRWPARGSVVAFTKEQIEELMFDPAFSNMVHEGLLYIEDMGVKKEIGLEPEDATEPTIQYIDEKTLDRFWRIIPIAQFKVELKNWTRAQLSSLAEYAIRHGNDGTIEKANYLSELTGYQVLKGIELEKQNQEA